MPGVMSNGGNLVLVVGPSGAGKDTILSAVRQVTAGNPRFVSPRREITRPADAGGEDHIAISERQFEKRERKNAYALSWRAHGLCYGVPKAIETDLALGRLVVVNTSRTVIALARERYPGLQIIVVTAPAEVLADRLAQRGRETRQDILKRLARSAPVPSGDDIWEIDNRTVLSDAVDQFLAALRTIDARFKAASGLAAAS